MSQVVVGLPYAAMKGNSSSDGNQKKGSNSFSSLFSTLIPALLTALLFLSLFLSFRTRVKRVYTPRTFAGVLSEHQKTPEPSDSKFGWIKQFWSLPDTFALNHHSLDAYLLLRFWRTIILVCLVGWPLTWAVLMPVYATAHSGGSQFDRISFSNIRSSTDSGRLYAVVLVAFVFLGTVMYIIARECVHVIQLKQAFLLLPGVSSRMSTKTVLFTNVPGAYCNEDKIRQVFPAVRHVWLVTDTQDLQQLVQDRDETAMRLEEAVVKLSRKANENRLKAEKHKQARREDEVGLISQRWVEKGQRPTHRLRFLVGTKVDSIDWCREHLEKVSSEIKNEQKKHRESKAKTRHAVFVEFEDVATAEAAFRNIDFKLPRGLQPRTIGTRPQEIIWNNLNMTSWQRRVGNMIAIAIIVLMIVFWGVIIAFIGSLANIDSWAKDVPVLNSIYKIPHSILGLITGLLPALLLSQVMSYVPVVMRLLFETAGAASKSEVELKTQTWHFIFQFIQVFLVTTLASGAAASVTKILDDPSQATTLLAENLPKASNFYISYLVLQGLAAGPKQLLNAATVATFYIYGFIFDNTPRKIYNRYTRVAGLPWGKVYPKFTNLAVIAIAYSCIAPLLLAFAVIGFSILFFAFRYRIFYACDTLGTNTQGRAFAMAMQHLTTGVYVADLCLIGLFGISSAVGPTVLMILFLVLTALFHTLLNGALIHLESDLGRESHGHVESSGDQEESSRIEELGSEIGAQVSRLGDFVLRVMPAAVDNTDKATDFFVKLLRPPPLPQFDEYLSTPVPEYSDSAREKAYMDPAVMKSMPMLWIVCDELGVSEEEKEATKEVADVTDEGAWWDEKGKMRTVMDQQDTGQDDATTKAPIYKEKVIY